MRSENNKIVEAGIKSKKDYRQVVGTLLKK